MKNITHLIDEPEVIPLCFLCDQPIFEYEEIEFFTAHKCKGIVHQCCLEEEIEEYEEKERNK